jgi:hypothetical protein
VRIARVGRRTGRDEELIAGLHLTAIGVDDDPTELRCPLHGERLGRVVDGETRWRAGRMVARRAAARGCPPHRSSRDRDGDRHDDRDPSASWNAAAHG